VVVVVVASVVVGAVDDDRGADVAVTWAPVALDEHAAANKLRSAAAATVPVTPRDNNRYQSSPRNSRIVAMNCS
jgi:hypothetical protein